MAAALTTLERIPAGLSYERFCADARAIAAAAWNIVIVGEAARHVPPEVRLRYPHIPWAPMAGMRNILVHQYYEIEPGILWDTALRDAPPLVPLLEALLAREV